VGLTHRYPLIKEAFDWPKVDRRNVIEIECALEDPEEAAAQKVSQGYRRVTVQ
jgi:hypothetical protein